MWAKPLPHSSITWELFTQCIHDFLNKQQQRPGGGVLAISTWSDPVWNPLLAWRLVAQVEYLTLAYFICCGQGMYVIGNVGVKLWAVIHTKCNICPSCLKELQKSAWKTQRGCPWKVSSPMPTSLQYVLQKGTPCESYYLWVALCMSDHQFPPCRFQSPGVSMWCLPQCCLSSAEATFTIMTPCISPVQYLCGSWNRKAQWQTMIMLVFSRLCAGCKQYWSELYKQVLFLMSENNMTAYVRSENRVCSASC